jgi:uncharacterized protein
MRILVPMPVAEDSWLARLRASLPTRESLEQQPWLRPIAHRVTAPELWRARPEPLARGVALGLFWAFVAPVAQILLAVACCVWWRANIPAAASITLITNPLTIGPWLWLAHRIGSVFVDAPEVSEAAGAGAGALDWLQAMGWPVIVGMGILAVGGAIGGYVVMRVGAWMWFHWRLARRARRRSA